MIGDRMGEHLCKLLPIISRVTSDFPSRRRAPPQEAMPTICMNLWNFRWHDQSKCDIIFLSSLSIL